MPYPSAALLADAGLAPGLGSNTGSATAFVTQAYQVSIASAARPSAQFVMGPGTPFQMQQFLSLPLDGIRTDRAPRAFGHGSVAGVDMLDDRADTMTVVVFPDATLTPRPGGASSVQANVDALIGAWFDGLQTTDTPEAQDMVLRFMLPGTGVRRFYGRATKAAPVTGTSHLGYEVVLLGFDVTDPAQYADVEVASSLASLTVPTGGVSFPVAWPATFAPSSSAQVTVENSGRFTGQLRVVVRGPVQNPTLTNVTAGRYVGAAVSLPTVNDTVTFDFTPGAPSLTLADGSDVGGLITYGSQWWVMPRGNTLIRLDGTPLNDTPPTMQAFWRPAWL